MEKELEYSSSDTSSELLLSESTCCFIPNSLDFETSEDNTLAQSFKFEGLSNLSHLFCPQTGTTPLIESELDCKPVFDCKPVYDCKPDLDSIKMFVGQIPQNFSESDLLQMFEKYGKVFDLRVLRDKKTGRSKGCCFVTFFTRKAAINAQNALHNIKVLPGMHHAVQMKPADSENRNDRKVFIGMLPKTYSESDVRSLFSPFGTIEECTVLRNVAKESKGCAFVTYLTRHSALNAVKSMHHCHIFEGCSSPIVVKFADNQKDKGMRRLHLVNEFNDQFSSFCQQIVSNSILQQQIQKNCHFNGNPPLTLLNIPSMNNNYVTPLNHLQTPGSFGIQNTTNPYLMNQMFVPNPALFSLNNSLALNDVNTTQINSQVNMGPQIPRAENVFQTPPNNISFDQMAVRQILWDNFAVTKKQIEGPEGANLFIYHLPQEFTDQKLTQLFNPYGKVVSAKVFIDKATNFSKCFGFVSYDNVYSAKAAIENLNGYHILDKKLKVEVKTKKQLSKW